MRDEYNYLTEEELEAMIADVEAKSMLASPVYLKEQIMEEIRKETAVPLPHKEKPIRKKPNVRLLLYSAKIMAGAAAAVLCITVVPLDSGREMISLPDRNMEMLMEEDAERYEEEKQRLMAEIEADYNKEQEAWNRRYGESSDTSEGSGMGAIGDKLGIGRSKYASEIVNKISNLFGTEENSHE